MTLESTPSSFPSLRAFSAIGFCEGGIPSDKRLNIKKSRRGSQRMLLEWASSGLSIVKVAYRCQCFTIASVLSIIVPVNGISQESNIALDAYRQSQAEFRGPRGFVVERKMRERRSRRTPCFVGWDIWYVSQRERNCTILELRRSRHCRLANVMNMLEGSRLCPRREIFEKIVG